MLHVLLISMSCIESSISVGNGVTSPFRRKLEATVDMPLDSDVFKVPPGYNAPQQASYFMLNLLCSSCESVGRSKSILYEKNRQVCGQFDVFSYQRSLFVYE